MMPRSVRIDRPQPTWKQGFARSAGESAYPNLWKGLEFALVPELGPTGVTLREVIGGEHGTLTNMEVATDWIVDDGAYCLETNATDEHINVPAPNMSFPGEFTFSQWFNPNAWQFFNSFDWGRTDADHLTIKPGTAATDLKFKFDVDFAGIVEVEVAGLVVPGDWNFACVTRDAGDTLHLHFNGVQQAGSASRGGTFEPSQNGTDKNMQIPTAREANGQPGKYGTVLWHNRRLNANEIKQLYDIGRGGIFQRRPITIAKAPVGGIDSRAKRFCMMNFGDGANEHVLFEADGAVDADDRSHLLGLYCGIPLASPPTGMLFRHPGMTGRMQDMVGGMLA